ncbi:MAG: hypothetical protein ACF8PG_12690 [Maioricimonas sp. JB045]|uniref:hypothetical protein n=1 Tax=Maioricimonas sp. JC845 TaxID=3232138 RepID=UPI0034573F2E
MPGGNPGNCLRVTLLPEKLRQLRRWILLFKNQGGTGFSDLDVESATVQLRGDLLVNGENRVTFVVEGFVGLFNVTDLQGKPFPIFSQAGNRALRQIGFLEQLKEHCTRGVACLQRHSISRLLRACEVKQATEGGNYGEQHDLFPRRKKPPRWRWACLKLTSTESELGIAVRLDQLLVTSAT